MILYRAECYSQVEVTFRNHDRYDIRIYYNEFEVIKETSCGYWIKSLISPEKFNRAYDWNKKWVSKTAVKRFAYPTKKEALFNFIKRRERHIKILTKGIERSKQILAIAQQKMEAIGLGYDK